ncbi:MAG: hypothetical protein QOH33_696 [Paraburkholderia sp.]|nr:hypothetical protein [Paraburkholderia sp.]
MENPFNERGVMITRNGLSASGQVFSLRDIQDVRVVTMRKNKALPLAVSSVGVIVAATGAVLQSGAALAIGVMLIVVGALAWLVQDVKHLLLVNTAAGEREAVSSADLDFLARVERAVRTALTSSGNASPR